ncbi:DUF3576 domain-containing protein [Azospirillum sp. RWY-5-1]|uniref:DUF3576 domain-containing protein n=1 Tax=Azospirillum oleiclasticum TaxID=2735135 RepID=A0ABX2T7B8_9PROT|nr:DUF3576 domain-containing protein [Azospirillum oleiclasticum]NYZ13108.1 DUF3576 domain-containing protein [Azospirillum oleiclasticum]NYZ20219.1 DUF3576 domain-containing protein [Azospirillum oleiclasticum]
MRASRISCLRPALIAAVLALAGCSGWGGQTETMQDQVFKDQKKYGSILGAEGGINLFGGNKKQGAQDNSGGGIGVNSYLWRASLDTLSFMPIVSADPFGGVILTDWYSPPDSPGERFKVNLYILDRQLRADGVRVSVFRQQRAGNDWRDAGVSGETAGTLEDAILTRARQLRVAQTASR